MQASGAGDGEDPVQALLEATRSDKQHAEDRLTKVEQELAVARSQGESLKRLLENRGEELQVRKCREDDSLT